MTTLQELSGVTQAATAAVAAVATAQQILSFSLSQQAGVVQVTPQSQDGWAHLEDGL